MTIENMMSATRFRKYRLKIIVLGKILRINLFNGSKLALTSLNHPANKLIFNKREWVIRNRTQYHRAIIASLIHCTTTGYNIDYMEYSNFYHKKLKFSAQKSKKKNS